MNLLLRRILFTALAAAIALPTVHAAKANKKKTDMLPPTFASTDKDANGDVSETEYVETMKGVLGESGAKTKFAEIDKNHDGKVSKDEFSAANPEPEKKKKRNKKPKN